MTRLCVFSCTRYHQHPFSELPKFLSCPVEYTAKREKPRLPSVSSSALFLPATQHTTRARYTAQDIQTCLFPNSDTRYTILATTSPQFQRPSDPLENSSSSSSIGSSEQKKTLRTTTAPSHSPLQQPTHIQFYLHTQHLLCLWLSLDRSYAISRETSALIRD